MKYQTEPTTTLQLWEFERAPAKLRRQISQTHSGGWIALISPGGAEDVIEELVSRWLSSGLSIELHRSGEEGVVMACSPIRS